MLDHLIPQFQHNGRDNEMSLPNDDSDEFLYDDDFDDSQNVNQMSYDGCKKSCRFTNFFDWLNKMTFMKISGPKR